MQPNKLKNTSVVMKKKKRIKNTILWAGKEYNIMGWKR